MKLLDTLFKKKGRPRLRGRVVLIDFTPGAKENALPGPKEMLLFYDQSFIEKRPYTEALMKDMLKDGWFVWDKTMNHEVSEESVAVPDVQLLLGRLQLHRYEGVIR